MIVDLLLIACLIIDVALLLRARPRTPPGIEVVPHQQMPVGWKPPRAGLDWFDVPPPVPVDRNDAAPTDFDG